MDFLSSAALDTDESWLAAHGEGERFRQEGGRYMSLPGRIVNGRHVCTLCLFNSYVRMLRRGPVVRRLARGGSHSGTRATVVWPQARPVGRRGLNGGDCRLSTGCSLAEGHSVVDVSLAGRLGWRRPNLRRRPRDLGLTVVSSTLPGCRPVMEATLKFTG